ncbi:hypothetical protein AVEN_139676-1 [Araneus ventricosus]|uniref:Uncharacterized protein n=1 Tax=Araneus ventricosus TaxID=182803 RepID=A0A4Y2NAP4_ARAVE|nr:hypothetical protein AVEN_139676-1 [Araneus ventricosus]
MSIVDRLDFPPRHLLCSVTHGMGKKLLVANDLGGIILVKSVVADQFDFVAQQKKKSVESSRKGILRTVEILKAVLRFFHFDAEGWWVRILIPLKAHRVCGLGRQICGRWLKVFTRVWCGSLYSISFVA